MCSLLKLTANRGDCLSIVGIARELQAITGVSVQHPVVNDDEVTHPGPIAINIDDDNACELYMGLSISGVNPGAKTPEHILRKLERSGIRGISPIVDLTNYVMLELGQPMHAFDQDKIQGDVSVRMGKKGEALELLNGQVLEVSNDMLMICDDSGPVALAGIMGGQPTAVNDQTSNIFLEAAVFSTQSVAGKWRSLGFSTDALHRFERGVDPAGTKRALWRLANLITEICGGNVETLTESGEY
jgi:phenylalanyl-tRNA synthetase beta chain